MSLNLPGPRPCTGPACNQHEDKKEKTLSDFTPGHLQKALSLLPSLFITVFIHYGPYQTVSLALGHSCSVPPGIVTRVTHWPNIWWRYRVPCGPGEKVKL